MACGLRCEAANLNAVAPRKPLAEPKTDKGKFIRARREELGLSRRNLAQRLKTGVRTVAAFESDEYRRVTPQTARRLAEALELEVSAFRDFIWFKGKEPISGLGKLVRDRRHERGLSQRQLAAKLGKTYQLVSLIETGKVHLGSKDHATLANLARELDLDIVDLERLRPPRKLKEIKTKPNSLGAFAFDRRTKLGLTQSALGRRVGLSPTTVSDIERGMCRPKPRVLAKMQTALGCEIPPNLVSAARS